MRLLIRRIIELGTIAEALEPVLEDAAKVKVGLSLVSWFGFI